MADQWYSSQNESGWYASSAAHPPRAAAPRRRRGWLIPLGVFLGVIALIALSAAIFRNTGSTEELPPLLPNDGSGDSGFAEDFRDYFENFYIAQETPKACLIPTVDRFEDITVNLLPSGDKLLTLQEIYEKCAPSVVAVTAYIDETRNDRYYWGTGIILTADGYIVTNSHVVEGSCRAKVTLWNDEEYEVRLVGYDSRSDIAVLKIDAQELTPAEFCDTDYLAVGDQVVAIGNPLGNEFRSTMTEGIISGIDRDISYNGTTLTLLQTSAPINEGNSGGPLINMYGQVIGITNMKMSNTAGEVTIEGVGFAIPSRTVKTMADSILHCGEVLGRPALGLTLGAIPDEAMENYDMPGGLYVSAVADGSDCKEKGILPGDVITSVNGQSVTSTKDVTDVIASLNVGDTMELSVWRKGADGAETFTVTVTLVDVNDVYKVTK